MTPWRRVLQEKRTLVWPVVGALILNAALFALVVYPLSQKVAGGEAEADAAAAALASARQEYAAARATVTGKDTADAELQKFYTAVLPPNVSGARAITYLKFDQLARAANLELDRQNSDPSQERDSKLGKLSWKLVLTGQYRDIRRFIHQLETSPEFLVLENVTLAQGQENRGLVVSLTVSTYFRTADGT